jgi:hypothetical protein
MKVFILFGGVGMFLMSATADLAARGYDSFEGKWIWIAEESHATAGAPAPAKEQTHTVIKDDGTILRFTNSFTPMTGNPTSFTFDGAYDGKWYPIGNGAQLKVRHVSANAFRQKWKFADGSGGKEVCMLAVGRAKLTCTGTSYDKTGKSFPYVDVWKRTFQ